MEQRPDLTIIFEINNKHVMPHSPWALFVKKETWWRLLFSRVEIEN